MVEVPPAVRRPRDRKAQLARAAAELFRKHGYHAVGVGDIAAEVGISGPAIYRHFHNKQDILAHVVLSGFDAMAELTESAFSPGTDPAQACRELLLRLAALSVERRDATALWRWEGRHLRPSDQKEIRRRATELMARWTESVCALRPGLSSADAELLCWAAMSVYGSVADHHATLPARRFEQLLATMADAVIHSSVVPHERPVPVAPAEGDWRAPLNSRREELLTMATRLFRQRGFQSVSMEDIGAAAGIAGPSVYRHFASKADLLLAAGNRMGERLAVGAARALAEASDPRDALARLAQSYVDTALSSVDLIVVYASEMANLPDRARKELLAVQRDYVAEWIRLLRTVDPELSPAAARIVVQAALTVVNDLGRTPRILDRPHLAEELTELAVTVLHAGS